MMNKSKILLFVLALYSTSSAFAMDDDGEYNQEKTSSSARTTIAKKRTLKEIKWQRKVSFLRVLSLYEDQAEHYEHMHNLLTKQKEKLLTTTLDEEFYKIMEAIFGIPAKKMLTSPDTEGSVPIKEVLNHLSSRYQIQAQVYRDLVNNRKEKVAADENSIFTQLAAIYHGTVVNFNATQDRLLEIKRDYAADLSEEEIKTFYEARLREDTCAFYKIVQKKILQEFKLNTNKIFEKLVQLSKNTLKNEEKLAPQIQKKVYEEFVEKHKVLGKDLLKNEQQKPTDLKMTPKDVQFCKDVISGRYQFPSLESFEELAVTFEDKEEQKSDTIQTTTIRGANYEKNKKKNERKKRAKLAKQPPSLTSSKAPIVNSTDASSTPNGTESESQQVAITTSYTEAPPLEKSSSNIVDSESTNTPTFSFVQLEKEKEKEEADSLLLDLEKRYEKDRQAKKQPRKKVQPSLSSTEELKNPPRMGINKKKHTFLSEILAHPVNLNLRWKSIVSLFNSTSGFKGNVYGGNNGSTNTFELFFRFQKGQIASFLSEKEFQELKEDAEPQSLKERNFLPGNKRLQSYQLSFGETIGTSFFTLDNPHPYPFAYRDLVERLQKQLGLLGITLESVKANEGE